MNKGNNVLQIHLRLSEVDFIRPILVLLLIIVHSFTVYNGGWHEPAGFESNVAYAWIAKFSFSFLLETFTFISGYIFMFQVLVKKKFKTLIMLINDKIPRLIVPSIVFSIIYLILFKNIKNEETILDMVYQVLNGVGHMWFLPMLFWCFVFGWVVIKYDIKKNYIWLLLIGFALVSYIPLPFRAGIAFYYLPFFIGGGLVYKFYSDKIKENITIGCIICLWISYFILFIGLTILKDYLTLLLNDVPLLYKAICISSISLIKIIYSAVGVLSLYCTAIYYTKKYRINPRMTEFGKYCFGIYIIHQFILRIIYFKTNIPVIVGSIWLPWIGFTVTIVFSTIMSYALLKTRVGHILMG